MQKRYIGVIGTGETKSDSLLEAAEKIGFLIAGQGGILVCGGRAGVMEAACRGAKQNNGLTVGFLPGFSREEANPYVDVAVPTGMGYSLRNFLTVRTADVLIMLHGEIGTLSEAILSYQHGKPLVALQTTGGWANRLQMAAYDDGAHLDSQKLTTIEYADTAEQAVEIAFKVPINTQFPRKL